MSYTAAIDRTNPSCFLFLIDQSGSMEDPMAGASKRKADSVADSVNRILSSLIIKCARGEGIRDYYDIGVIGYGASVGPAFTGALTGRSMVPIREVANSPSRVDERTKKVDDGAGGLVNQTVKFPIWFDPVANGGTPMCEVLHRARQVLEEWVSNHSNSYPPIVINITDGEATDGNPLPAAQELSNLSTNDGNVLVFNCHVSSSANAPLIFHDNEAELPDEYARLLFQMSSQLPEALRDTARAEDFKINDRARGFAFNANLEALIRFLDIGTRAANLR